MPEAQEDLDATSMRTSLPVALHMGTRPLCSRRCICASRAEQAQDENRPKGRKEQLL